MTTDDLVADLSRGLSAVRPSRHRLRLAVAAVAGLALSMILLLLIFGVRADFSPTSGPVLLKAVYGLTAAAATAPFLLEVSRPSTSVGREFLPIWIFAALNVLVGILVMVLTPLDLRMSAWTSDQFPECLYRIPLLSLPIAMALTLAVRGLGATRLTLAGSAIGAVSGSLAAIVYAGCCPADSILYVVSWYLASVLLCAAAGAVVLSRMLKW